jgi:hypothetical protein
MSINLSPSGFTSGVEGNGRRYTGADSTTQVVITIIISALVMGIVLGIMYISDQIKQRRMNK